MDLELKHLSPYHEHKPTIIYQGHKHNISYLSTKRISLINRRGIGEPIKLSYKNATGKAKIALYPLHYLDEEIIIDDRCIIPVESFDIEIEGWCDAYDEWWNYQYPDFEKMMPNAPYEVIQKLFEWKIDVFNLIPNGLAVDINTL